MRDPNWKALDKKTWQLIESALKREYVKKLLALNVWRKGRHHSVAQTAQQRECLNYVGLYVTIGHMSQGRFGPRVA